MAPVDSVAATGSNSLPIALFGGQILLVSGLTAHVLLTARRAAKSLPPSTRTRSQDPVRRRHAITFSVLAFLSLASVTMFAIIWRVFSYVKWAEHSNHETPGSLWSGWYGTGEAERWHLGDWITDIDLLREADAVAVMNPDGFLYTSQYFVGLLATSIFMGVEGHRRNLPASTIASFVILSSLGSLGYALSLFFVTILYTPISQHKDGAPMHDSLFTPLPIVYDLGIVVSVLALNLFPELVKDFGDVRVMRLGYLVMPLFFAFAPQIVPVSLGRQHTSKAAAHRSYAKVFYVLSIASFLLYWRLFISRIYVNTPNEESHIWNVFSNSVGKKKPNRLLSGISITGQKLKHISKDPAISVTSLDVLFTTISLLTWTFTRDLDVDAILENSILSFLAPKHEKHVAFEDQLAKVQEHFSEPVVTETTTPKKRGRPSKKAAAVNGTSAPPAAPPASTGSVRRSSRKKTRSVDLDSDAESITSARKTRSADYESDGDSTYQPSEKTKLAVANTEADGVTTAEDLASASESTALALFLAFAGGLGQLAAGALGAEVSGPRDA
ncbi:Nn.00g008560.m01.CDS01 [Neocucurbitaria sp. VM-36]